MGYKVRKKEGKGRKFHFGYDVETLIIVRRPISPNIRTWIWVGFYIYTKFWC